MCKRSEGEESGGVRAVGAAFGIVYECRRMSVSGWGCGCVK